MWPLLIVGGIGFAWYKGLFASDEIKVTDKSNCHLYFIEFDNTISLRREKRDNLKRAHNTIREKLITYFSDQPNIPFIQFFIQGSYKMGTMVENMNCFSDVDLGIYFQEKPSIAISTIQAHLKQALIGHTSKGVEIKSMCVRLNYARDFHVDLPIYYNDDNGDIYFGSKSNGWQKSDPKDFIKWFKEETKDKPQLLRITRYLKAWTDYRKHETNKKYPSGLVITLWVIEYYQENERDDVSYTITCDNILKYLDANFQKDWEAKMPVAPYDNTLNRLNGNQKNFFYDDFKKMIEAAIRAMASLDILSAKGEWEQIFGNRFK